MIIGSRSGCLDRKSQTRSRTFTSLIFRICHTLSKQVVDNIIQLLNSGKMKPGDKLPPELALHSKITFLLKIRKRSAPLSPLRQVQTDTQNPAVRPRLGKQPQEYRLGNNNPYVQI